MLIKTFKTFKKESIISVLISLALVFLTFNTLIYSKEGDCGVPPNIIHDCIGYTGLHGLPFPNIFIQVGGFSGGGSVWLFPLTILNFFIYFAIIFFILKKISKKKIS
jgi:hypothetical protein